MNVNKKGDCCMSMSDLKEVAFSSNMSNISFLIKFYLIGDTKGLFQMLGRSGHDSCYCLLCQCRPKTWKSTYDASSGSHAATCVNAEKWKI